MLAMAMFVASVVDTSLMNVSISAVVGTRTRPSAAFQSAIALEALVSAAFILIRQQGRDLIGRKRAYVLGLLGLRRRRPGDGAGPGPDAIHRSGRWVGGIGASLLLPAMQSLIHGKLRRVRRRSRPTPWSGPAAAIAAAVGTLLGGFHHTLPVVARRFPARGR
jgi:MFS family permease